MIFQRLKSNFASVAWWSAISAAFIGPGTVTTAAKAGSEYGLSLLWTIVFATLACFVLQEATARLSSVSNRSLGENIATVFKNPVYKYLAGFSIIFGCMAYEAGNILGAVEGLKMIWPGSKYFFIGMIGALSLAILLNGKMKLITALLGTVVALMGICFIIAAYNLGSGYSLNLNMLLPEIPPHSDFLIIGLIGTTIVPYNLFLGSGMGRNQKIGEMRFGLFISILVGGTITAAVLLTGTFLKVAFTFESLKDAIKLTSGSFTATLIGIGLFCAGLSSAVTAPLAAAFTAQSLFADNQSSWKPQGKSFRSVWLFVLLIGIGFSFLKVKPIPVIITAQALNGLILPFIAIALLLAINSTKCVGNNRNRLVSNLLLAVVVLICVVLGVRSLWAVFQL